MKDFYKYRFVAIVSLAASICYLPIRIGGQNIWTQNTQETVYPNLTGWLFFFGCIILFLLIIFTIITYNLKNKNTSNTKIKQLSNKEEQSIIEKSINQKVSELKKLYPNGWNMVQMKHPNYSNAEMVSAEKNIIFEQKKFQQDKENARSEYTKRIAAEKIVKKNLSLLSQATQVGDIELAEKTIKALKNVSESSPIDIDKELIRIIEENKNEFNQKYSNGISDTFENSYVDYTPPFNFVQADNWHYPVAKFPDKDTFVFPYRRRKIARRGYMDHPFYTYLASKLGNYKLLILNDCAILPADNYRPYEPDIAIIDIEHPSIRIDIEVDEPYSAISNKPIHYIGCGDDFRDKQLNNLGWIVVRFTEYQVKTDMQGCASFIVQLFHSLNPSTPLPESLLHQNFPQSQKRWTEIGAKIMACEKVREKYLNHVFGIEDSEQIEITDIKQTEREKACTKFVRPLKITSYDKNQKNNSTVFDRDNHIQFFPQEHIYLYNGLEKFIPVSSIISCFFKPFNSYYWAEIKAKEKDVSQGQVLEGWDAEGTRSRNVGTFMHQQIENHYKGLPYQQEFSFRYEGKYVHIKEHISLKPEYSQFIEFLREHKFNPFRTEWTIYDEELKIAGTIDMIHKRENIFDIYDWKRSHKIVDLTGKPIAVNNYGTKGLDELNQIEDTPYWHYCIQQNLYRYILKRNYNIRIGKMYLIVFHYTNNKYRKLEVPHMDETINSIVEACKNGIVKQRLITLQEGNLSKIDS